MTHTQDRDLRIRLAEIMSSAGLGYNRISLEVLYLLPREFIDRYIEVWNIALGPNLPAPGDSLTRSGELGRAKTRGDKKGLVVGAGSGGSPKRWNRVFCIRNEEALALKDRMDKRLRSMAREMRVFLQEQEDNQSRRTAGLPARQSESEVGKGRPERARTRNCVRCGRIMIEAYRYCPFDGSAINGSPIDPQSREIA